MLTADLPTRALGRVAQIGTLDLSKCRTVDVGLEGHGLSVSVGSARWEQLRGLFDEPCGS